jgi:hypothetical protein
MERGANPEIIGVPLLEVKRVAIEAYGVETLDPKLREAMAAALQATRRFTVAQSRNDADAVLKVSTKQASASQPDDLENITVMAMLVNAKGYAVWPAKTNGSGEIYNGNANELAAKIAASIMKEIQKTQNRNR